MYTYCRIRFTDDNTEWDVVIKSDETVIAKEDESIFFYGLSPEALKKACEEKTVIEGEWIVLSVDLVTDKLL